MGQAPVLTLTTDFGTADGYVGALKGVLATHAPGVPLVDLTHDLPPFDTVSALLALRTAAPRFPPGTVHLVVVDPGVGTARRGLVVHGNGHWFVGADNGVFPALFAPGQARAYAIHAARFDGASATFHGRDVFAPVAAALARGEAIASLGDPIDDAARLQLATASRVGNIVKGSVIHVDRFGNLITNVARKALNDSSHVAVSLGRQPVKFARTFGDVNRGDSVAYWGSGGLLEIAVREGRAVDRFGGVGGEIEVIKYA